MTGLVPPDFHRHHASFNPAWFVCWPDPTDETDSID